MLLLFFVCLFLHRLVLSQVKQKTPIILPGFEVLSVPDELSGQYSVSCPKCVFSFFHFCVFSFIQFLLSVPVLRVRILSWRLSSAGYLFHL